MKHASEGPGHNNRSSQSKGVVNTHKYFRVDRPLKTVSGSFVSRLSDRDLSMIDRKKPAVQYKHRTGDCIHQWLGFCNLRRETKSAKTSSSGKANAVLLAPQQRSRENQTAWSRPMVPAALDSPYAASKTDTRGIKAAGQKRERTTYSATTSKTSASLSLSLQRRTRRSSESRRLGHANAAYLTTAPKPATCILTDTAD